MTPRPVIVFLLVVAACNVKPASPDEKLTALRPALREAQEIPIAGLERRAWYAAADDARETLVTLDSERRFAVVRSSGIVSSRSMRDIMREGGCGHGKEDPMLGFVSVGISGDGREAWFLGMDGSKTEPQRMLTAACIVDIASGAARSMRNELGDPVHLRAHTIERSALPSVMIGSKVAVLWGARDEIEVVRRGTPRPVLLDVGTHAGPCEVREAGNELDVACVMNAERGLVSLSRFDLSEMPPRLIVRNDVDLDTAQPVLVLSTDGRHVAYRGQTPISKIPCMGVATVHDGKIIEALLLVRRTPLALDIASKRGGVIMTYGEGPTALQGFDGTEEQRFDLGCRPRALFLSPDASRVWCHSLDDHLRLYATN